MSKINDVVQRAISDAAFRTQLRSDPAKALRGLSLSPEETRALTSGDPARLTALGVDQRMSKMFTTGFASSHSSVSGGDVARGVSTASLTSSGGALSASHASTNAHGDPDAIFSGSDDPSAALVSGDDAHASLQPNRVLGGDPDYVPASGDTSSSALISPAPEDAEAVPQFHSTGEASLGEGGTAAGPGSGDLNEIQP